MKIISVHDGFLKNVHNKNNDMKGHINYETEIKINTNYKIINIINKRQPTPYFATNMANTISIMSNAIRNAVSKKRIRYKEKGYNLDLTCKNHFYCIFLYYL